MNFKWKFFAMLFLFICFTSTGYGQEPYSKRQKEVLKTMELLSETTAPGGKGGDAYGDFLTKDFSRWTIGNSITNNKEKWVEGIKEWFDDGWRVSKRENQIIEIVDKGDFIFTRRIVTETYLGPKEETSSSTAALSETWISLDGKWLLLRVDVHPIGN